MSMYISKVNRVILLAFISFAALPVFAQQEEERRATIDSIDVVRDYRPILADAVKIRRSPDMTNKREYQPKLTYNIIDKKLDITTGTRRLDIQELSVPPLVTRTTNYAKIGVGSFSTLYGEAYLVNNNYEDTRFGAYAKHLSQKGSLIGQQFSQQEISAFGRQLYDAFTVSGDLGYKRYGTRFYGAMADAGPGLNPDPELKQAFNDVFLNAELTSNKREGDDEALSYSLRTKGYLYSDAFEAKENSFLLSGYLEKQRQAFRFGAHVSADFTNVVQKSSKLGNHLANINPYIRFKGQNYNLTVGVNLVSEFGDSTRTNVFPNVSLDFSLIPDYADLYATVDGGVIKTSFKELTRENPWLMPDITIANTVERLRISAGIKGNAGAMFGYKAGISYRKLENMPLFQNYLFNTYQFDVVYDGQDKAVSVFGIEGEINLRISEAVSLGGRLIFNEYNMQDKEEAWHLPKLQLAANTRINISERLYVNGELLFMGQRYSTGYLPGYYLLPGPGPTTVEKVTIPAFLDLSAGLEFRVTERIGVFARVNNLFNTEYQRYLHYPRLGLNVIGGVNFTF